MKSPGPHLERTTTDFVEVLHRLSILYEHVPVQAEPDPFELILAENVAYMANDARRAEAMTRLRAAVGTTPEDILRATPEALAEIAELGILPENSARKLHAAAEIATREFAGDVTAILDLPLKDAKRGLRRFPGIGEPGAEKILLLCRRHASLAPESNALRVLVRVGFCPPDLSYSATYAVARDLGREALGDDIDRMISARYRLRRLGQEICRRRNPSCDTCPLSSLCRFALEGARQEGG